MAKIRNRRKRLFIDELQVRLLSINVAYFAAILLIFAVALFAPLVIQLVGSTEGPEWEQQLVAAQFLYLSNTIWLPLVLTFVALGAHSVLISHRIAGPLYRLRSLLRSVAEGNFVARAALRDKDYLKTDAKVVNDMIEKLSALIEDVDERAYELHKTVQQLKTAFEAGQTQDVQTCLGDPRPERRVARCLAQPLQDPPGGSDAPAGRILTHGSRLSARLSRYT